jgi:hypothetical protein
VEHDQAMMGIPYVRARQKSQGFGADSQEILRFMIFSESE